MHVLVFDIETIPDLEAARRYYGFTDIDDEQVVQAIRNIRRQESTSDFLPPHMHRIIAISAVYATNEQVKVRSLGLAESTEAELIHNFFEVIEKRTPTLVSWNGGQFDLPVLHYRALLHGVSAHRYFESGDRDNEFRYNNYVNRYHARHTDLMDVLAAYHPRAYAPLDQLASSLGLPGKMGMDGSLVYDYYKQGKLNEIRDYCETDVLNTYLIYIRFEYIRGHLSLEQYMLLQQQLKDNLQAADQPHLREFLQRWQDGQTWLKSRGVPF